MRKIIFSAISFSLVAVAVHAQEARDAVKQEIRVQNAVAAEAVEQEKPVVQLAILLDNSGSMGGLINQARSELWKVVNEFVSAKFNGVSPKLQVAVYHYGSPPATRLVELTDDLDRVSEALFSIPVNGGSEFCGQVISMATKDLEWSGSNSALKLIFIAGNERFNQGPVAYQEACKEAIEKGIIVNTIHCGNGIPTGWQHAADLADGKAMNINHTDAVVHIEAPQDARIAELGVEINKTYIAFGKGGIEGEARQKAQDSNAAESSQSSSVNRGLAKANRLYKNSSWDLCDAFTEKKIDLAKIAVEDLPGNMRTMTVEEREQFVNDKLAERKKISDEINQLNAERKEFVTQKRREMAEETGEEADTLDTAVIKAIRAQAEQNQYTFEETSEAGKN